MRCKYREDKIKNKNLTPSVGFQFVTVKQLKSGLALLGYSIQILSDNSSLKIFFHFHKVISDRRK